MGVGPRAAEYPIVVGRNATRGIREGIRLPVNVGAADQTMGSRIPVDVVRGGDRPERSEGGMRTTIFPVVPDVVRESDVGAGRRVGAGLPAGVHVIYAAGKVHAI